MNNAKYVGMDRATGHGLTDINHIRQSLADILITPVGSRPMRRAYGSLLSELLDQPQNDALRLHIMAACYSAILAWDLRQQAGELYGQAGELAGKVGGFLS